MIRILHVLGGLERGGAETMVMNLYRKIDREKIQFDFIIHTKEKQSYYNEIIDLGGKIYSFPKFNGANRMLLKRKWTEFFINHPEYKILHSHIRSYASLYLPIAAKYNLKTIIHSHSISNGKGIASIVKKVMQYPLRYQADYFFACSNDAGKWLFGKNILKSDKYYVIKNAIDTKIYKFNEDIREKYRNELNVLNKKVYIHVGRFHDSKNHLFLLDVFNRILSKTDAILWLVGDGDLRYEIMKRIDELNMKNSVVLLGVRDDVNNLMQAADCFLFPSKFEGLGIVAVEAQATGLPCVCSQNVPGDVKLTELCEFVSADDIDQWVNLATRDIECKREYYNSQVVNVGYDIAESAQWLENFYQEILK